MSNPAPRNISFLVKGMGYGIDLLRNTKRESASIEGDKFIVAVQKKLPDERKISFNNSDREKRETDITSTFSKPDVLVAMAEANAENPVREAGGTVTASTRGIIAHEVICRFPPIQLTDEQMAHVEKLGPGIMRLFFRSIQPSFIEVPPSLWNRINDTAENRLLRSYFSLSDWMDYWKMNSETVQEIRKLNRSNLQTNKPLVEPWFLGPNAVIPRDIIDYRYGNFRIVGATMYTGYSHVFAGFAIHRWILDTEKKTLTQIQIGAGTNAFRLLDIANNSMFPHLWGVGWQKLTAILRNPEKLLQGPSGMMNTAPLSISNRALHQEIRADCNDRILSLTELIIRLMNATSGVPAGLRNIGRSLSRFWYGVPTTDGPIVRGSDRDIDTRVMEKLTEKMEKGQDDKRHFEKILKDSLGSPHERISLAQLKDFHEVLDAREDGTEFNLTPEQVKLLLGIKRNESAVELAVTKEAEKIKEEVITKMIGEPEDSTDDPRAGNGNNRGRGSSLGRKSEGDDTIGTTGEQRQKGEEPGSSHALVLTNRKMIVASNERDSTSSETTTQNKTELNDDQHKKGRGKKKRK
ncbi:hypothetical protein H6F96_19565 [Microcoleus sp. FACHB-53]|nr:hypothetical protein [Microcoleus sp. FACHB-53]